MLIHIKQNETKKTFVGENFINISETFSTKGDLKKIRWWVIIIYKADDFLNMHFWGMLKKLIQQNVIEKQFIWFF